MSGMNDRPPILCVGQLVADVVGSGAGHRSTATSVIDIPRTLPPGTPGDVRRNAAARADLAPRRSPGRKGGPPILCVGQLVAGLVVRPVDAFPRRGQATLVEDLKLVAGGCAANTACVLAKLGADVRIAKLMGETELRCQA